MCARASRKLCRDGHWPSVGLENCRGRRPRRPGRSIRSQGTNCRGEFRSPGRFFGSSVSLNVFMCRNAHRPAHAGRWGLTHIKTFDVTCLVAAERQGPPNGPVGGDALYRRASPLKKQSPGLFFHSPLAELFNAMQGSALHPPRALPLDPGRERAAPCTPQLFEFVAEGGHHNSEFLIPNSALKSASLLIFSENYGILDLL